MQIIPYKASPDIVVALLRNDVQMLVEFPPAVKGQVTSGDTIFNTSNENRKVRVPRMFRMHSDDREEIQTAEAGDIVAFDALVTIRLNQTYRVARAILGGVEEAEDG